LANKKVKTIKDLFTKERWAALKESDPSIEILGAASWQDPDNFASASVALTQPFDIFEQDDSESKDPDKNRYELQKECWKQYKTFGPLNSAVDTKAYYVAGAGFSVYSLILELNEFIKDFFYSYRNRLYSKCIGWIIRQLAEGENFILISLDEKGNATLRNIEPTRIGDTDDNGIISDPDDVTQTLFYLHKLNSGKEEWIPDARFILDGDYMKERRNALGDAFKKSKIKKITKGTGKFKKFGGYRRFLLHWKNFSGIHEFKRDTSSLITTLQWSNLYTKALKWELDYKRALSAYTLEIKFEDSPAGKVAWSVWKKMTDAEKAATNLTKPLSPGSRVFVMPGMAIKIQAPQLGSLSGQNQDLLNLAGAGAKTPQDMFQGQTAGQTYASIRSTRPPLMNEIENLQHISKHFFLYELIRVCLHAKITMGGIVERNGKKYKLQETYMKKFVEEMKEGKPKIVDVPVEPCEMIEMDMPSIRFDAKPDETANAYFGSKHTGVHGAGVSRKTALKKMGVSGLDREIRERALEDEEYGEIISGVDAEKNVEKELEPGNTKKERIGEAG
jgi:hypothetical protein